MKEKTVKLFKKNWVCIISSLIMLFFFLIFMLVSHIMPFGKNTFVIYDGAAQVYPFMVEFYNKLINHESLYYSWSGGMGVNFLATYFYYLSSPINLLVVFSGGNIEGFINFSIIIRIILSAYTFGFYLTRKDDVVTNRVVMIPLSCAYSLSNYILVYFYESMWLDSVMIFPIIMLGYKRMLKEKKPWLYIISLFYSAFCNYYITYMIGFFLILWFLFDDFTSIKKFFSCFFNFLIYSLLAAGMSAISLVVSFNAVMTTHIKGESLKMHYWFGGLFEVFRYIFIFSNPHPLGMDVNLNTSNLYAGTFVIVLLCCYLTVNNIHIIKKIKRLILLLFIFLSLDESILNYLWHSFHVPIGVPNRFSFIYIFLVLITCSEVFPYLNKENIKRIIVGTIFALFVPMVSYFFIDFDSIITSKSVLLLSLVLVMIYNSIFIFMSYFDNSLKIVYIFLTVLMVVELILNASFVLKRTVDGSWGYAEKIDKELSLVIDNIKINEDSEFYRTDVFGQYINNGGFLYNTNGTELFSSIFSEESRNIHMNSGVFSGRNGINSLGYPEILDDLLSEKYCIINKNEDFYEDRNGYIKVFDGDKYNIYKNDDALTLGFGVKKNIKEFKLDYYNPPVFLNDISSYMADVDPVYETSNPDYSVYSSNGTVQKDDAEYISFLVDGSLYDNRNITVNFECDKTGGLYIFYEDNQSGYVEVEINNIKKRTNLKEKELSYIGECNEGDNVTIVFMNDNTTNPSISQEMINLIVATSNQNEKNKLINELSKNEMNILDINDQTISAEVFLDSNQVLFTSIPYDDGWSVYENGKKINVDKYVGSFIGLDLGKGYHLISFKYVPKGLYFGIFISVVSWLVYVCCIIFKVRSSKVNDLTNVKTLD